jgi:hypothetical protein
MPTLRSRLLSSQIARSFFLPNRKPFNSVDVFIRVYEHFTIQFGFMTSPVFFLTQHMFTSMASPPFLFLAEVLQVVQDLPTAKAIHLELLSPNPLGPLAHAAPVGFRQRRQLDREGTQLSCQAVRVAARRWCQRFP